jgi:hypothetical protein
MSHVHQCSSCSNEFECFYSDDDCEINEGDKDCLCDDCAAYYEDYTISDIDNVNEDEDL